MNDQKKGGSIQNYVIVAIIAFALGLGSGAMWANKKAPTDTNVPPVSDETASTTSEAITPDTTGISPDTSSSGAVTPTGAMIARNAIIVRNQKPGVSVDVAGISIDAPSWAVIREDDGGGNPGKILGAQLFDVGTTAGTVELLRGTEEGKTYFAMIYPDNGDNSFDPKNDKPLLRDDGSVVMMTFTTSASAPETTPNNL